MSFGCLEHVLLHCLAVISSLTLIFLKYLKIVTCSKTLKMPAFLCNLFSNKNSQWHWLPTIYKCSSITYIDFALVHHQLHCENIAKITFAKFMFISSDCQNGRPEVLLNHNRNYWYVRFPPKLLKFLQGVQRSRCWYDIVRIGHWPTQCECYITNNLSVMSKIVILNGRHKSRKVLLSKSLNAPQLHTIRLNFSTISKPLMCANYNKRSVRHGISLSWFWAPINQAQILEFELVHWQFKIISFKYH